MKILDRFFFGEQNLLAYITGFLDILGSKLVLGYQNSREKRQKVRIFPRYSVVALSRLQTVAVALGFHYSSTTGCKDHEQLAF